MAESDNKICPSSTCHVDALLLGVVRGDNTVALLSSPMKVTEDFIEIANKHGTPEKRFRFAGKCAKGGCAQWTGGSCGVMDELSAANSNLQVVEEALPECSLRAECRWFSQEGKKACMICPLVITDTYEKKDSI